LTRSLSLSLSLGLAFQLTLKQEARLFVDKGDRRDVNNGAPALSKRRRERLFVR
jgi:hypothetical protein